MGPRQLVEAQGWGRSTSGDEMTLVLGGFAKGTRRSVIFDFVNAIIDKHRLRIRRSNGPREDIAGSCNCKRSSDSSRVKKVFGSLSTNTGLERPGMECHKVACASTEVPRIDSWKVMRIRNGRAEPGRMDRPVCRCT